MKIVGFGNSNNLVWMIMFSAVNRLNATGILFAINKKKLRDIPPFSERSIAVTLLSDFSFFSGPSKAKSAQIEAALSEADLVLVSGEFYYFVEEFRRHTRRSVRFISIPIGFDIETMIIAYRQSPDSQLRDVSAKMATGLSLCDQTMFQDNSPILMQEEIRRAGLASQIPECWRHLHVFRTALAAKAVTFAENTSAVATAELQALQKSIFVASRICPDVPGSVANKGSHNIFCWISDNWRRISMLGLGVSIIDRDAYSRAFISELKAQCGPDLRIHIIGELSYPQFMLALRHCFVAIDSFDPDDKLRPHMTTSDAIAVGSPIVTSLGRTAVAEKLRQSRLLRCFASPTECLSDSFVLHREMEFCDEYLEQYQSSLVSSFHQFTDHGEAEFLRENPLAIPH
jgi:hypothetical protein